MRLSLAVTGVQPIQNIDGWLYTTVHRLVVDQAWQRNLLQRALARLASGMVSWRRCGGASMLRTTHFGRAGHGPGRAALQICFATTIAASKWFND